MLKDIHFYNYTTGSKVLDCKHLPEENRVYASYTYQDKARTVLHINVRPNKVTVGMTLWVGGKSYKKDTVTMLRRKKYSIIVTKCSYGHRSFLNSNKEAYCGRGYDIILWQWYMQHRAGVPMEKMIFSAPPDFNNVKDINLREIVFNRNKRYVSKNIVSGPKWDNDPFA